MYENFSMHSWSKSKTAPSINVECKGSDLSWAQDGVMERIQKDHQEVWFPSQCLFNNKEYWNQDTVEASTNIFIALGSNLVLKCHRLEKGVIHGWYLITCLCVSFQDSLDNSITCECTPEETDSSENSLHPDFTKVIKLTHYHANEFTLFTS